MNKEHRENLKYCTECDQYFLDDTVFQAHKVVHDLDPEDVVPCGICKELTKAGLLSQHLLFHHSGAQKPVPTNPEHICDKCERCFDSARRLQEHKVIHLDEEQRQLKCEFCSKTFLWKQSFIMHLLEVHETDTSLKKKLKCSSCEKSFLSPYTLERHESLHKRYDNFETSLKCGICEMRFLPQEQEKLINHVEDHNRCG